MSCPGLTSIWGWTEHLSNYMPISISPISPAFDSNSFLKRGSECIVNTKEKRTLRRPETDHLHKTFQNSWMQDKWVITWGYEKGQSVCIEWSRNLNTSEIFTAFMYRQLHKYNKDKMLQHKSKELKSHLLTQVLLNLNVRQGSYSHYSHIGLKQHFETVSFISLNLLSTKLDFS